MHLLSRICHVIIADCCHRTSVFLWQHGILAVSALFLSTAYRTSCLLLTAPLRVGDSDTREQRHWSGKAPDSLAAGDDSDALESVHGIRYLQLQVARLVLHRTLCTCADPAWRLAYT